MRKKRLQTVLAATAATACIIGGVAVAWKCLPVVTVENQEKVTVEQENKGITVHYFWALNDEPRVFYTEVDGNKVIKRLKPLTEIQNNATAVDTIKVTVEWLDDGTNNEADRIAGSVPNNVIEMPILIHAIQYTGGN